MLTIGRAASTPAATKVTTASMGRWSNVRGPSMQGQLRAPLTYRPSATTASARPLALCMRVRSLVPYLGQGQIQQSAPRLVFFGPYLVFLKTSSSTS